MNKYKFICVASYLRSSPFEYREEYDRREATADNDSGGEETTSRSRRSRCAEC